MVPIQFVSVKDSDRSAVPQSPLREWSAAFMPRIPNATAYLKMRLEGRARQSSARRSVASERRAEDRRALPACGRRHALVNLEPCRSLRYLIAGALLRIERDATGLVGAEQE